MAAASTSNFYTASGYDHRAFDTLPELEDSAAHFASVNGNDLLRTHIRGVFMRHGVNEDFAIALLHRHFEMDAGEKLVELGPVSSPWPIEADQDTVAGGHVLPRSWRVYEGELYPFEFSFVPKCDMAKTTRPVFPMAFVRELQQVLAATGLDTTLGQTLIDQERAGAEVELMEVTHGRNSIMIPATEAADLGGPSFQATWSFEPTADEMDGIVTLHGKCVSSPQVDGITTFHGKCVSSPQKDGIITLHGKCVSSPQKDGIVTLHGKCVSSPQVDGITTLHGKCVSSPQVDGITTLHGKCVSSPQKDGIVTFHGKCVSSPQKDGAGIVTLHGKCVSSPQKDGIVTLHGKCVSSPQKDGAGIVTLHGKCVSSPEW